MPVLSAFTGTPLAALPVSLPADARTAVERAREVHPQWRAIPLTHRLTILRTLGRRLSSQRCGITPAVVHGCGLGPEDAAADHRIATRLVTAYARTADKHLREHRRHFWFRADTRHLSPRPTAPSAVVSYVDAARPLASLVEGALPAMACGSTVITRVDAATVVVALRTASLARKAGLPGRVWQFTAAPGPGEAAQLDAVLAEHADARAPQCCACDGTAATASASGLLVVRHDAAVPPAARAAVGACFARAGRHCAGTTIVAVHDDKWPGFLPAFQRATMRETARMAVHSAIPPPMAAWADAWADTAITAGARPVLGAPGQFAKSTRGTWEPLVLAAPSWRETPFGPRPAGRPPRGPVALVIRYTAWSDVLHLARYTNRHLGIFTRTKAAQLLPQFAALPASDIRLNAAPRSGLLPLQTLRGLG
ncbi:aldehyde dehydrogenase family protein [Streptomyces sp. NPDC048595]|uniref:aldehyde dehydrogenase family protein n=1 Tax=Streptomyces sp. NPDC048595 TaxID=3365576 RepID=UPI003711A552